MAIRQATLHVCDYCGATTERPTKLWFMINSREHACEMCGHGIMDLLGRLGISYQKVCNKYSDESHFSALGTISFDPGAVVAATQVILLAAKAFQRPG